MNLRLLWIASLALVLLALSGAPQGAKVGCHIDPDGCKPPQGGSASPDGGSSMDPNGG